MSDLYISWSEYHQIIEILAIKIAQSHWQFDQIVCIAKGGLRIGDILCRLYGLPLAIFSTASYGGTDNRHRGKISLSQHLSMTTPTLGKRVLLVDDLVDSGVSLGQTYQWLHENYPLEEIRTAVLWYKSCSSFKPDYYVAYLADNPWIHQPFEIYEQITVEELKINLSSLI